MIKRQLNILKSQSFFLFGARGTGKTSLLHELFREEKTLWIDLLKGQAELQFSERPDSLSEMIAKQKPNWVVVDEVQKVPKLLDIAHHEIEKKSTMFALTGSSARKLKKGGANLLAGRAFVYNLFPFTHRELGDQFSLDQALQWGTLPRLFEFTRDEERKLFLENYVETYLKEEIFQEQLTRKIVPFRKFLKLAAQSNGTILNFKKIGEDIGIDGNTVRTYFDILEDTLLGFYLPATDRSFRKQQLKSPKFYLFDTGVKREIEGISQLPVVSSQEKGPLFEHWIITELFKLNAYKRAGYEFTYLVTQGGLEVDLVLQKPREKTVFIEIKSTDRVRDSHLANLISLRKDFPNEIYYCICQEPQSRVQSGIDVLPWRAAIEELGLA
ncbi:MAG: ATP-binding protein [Deltaproteobacteria bacterium]|nr:ATP-binding protein [Deltaproteobacteria bacterium]